MNTASPATDTDGPLAIFRERVDRIDARLPGYGLRWRALCRRLLGCGGRLVVPTGVPDDFLDTLLGPRLVVREGSEARLTRGRARSCHANTAALWTTERAATVLTGYALSEDGLWRQHSWALANTHGILETTTPRVRYAGVELTTAETLGFCRHTLAQDERGARLLDSPRLRPVAEDPST